jgi:hypothetical protein
MPRPELFSGYHREAFFPVSMPQPELVKFAMVPVEPKTSAAHSVFLWGTLTSTEFARAKKHGIGDSKARGD